MNAIVRWVLPITLAASLAGCAAALKRVEPWQREKLAGDLMRPGVNPMEDRDWDHIYFGKEAAPGNPNQGGGGCGCN